MSLLIALIVIPSGCNTAEVSGKLPVIRFVGTIGPLSIPLAYMVKNNVMNEVAETMSLQTWATPQQLQAVIVGGQADFVSLPVNAAATFYNKGMELKLLDCSIWNILFLVSSDPGIESVADLAGKRIVVPYQGAVPDAVFSYILQNSTLDMKEDVDIYYTPDPVQASQLLISGQEQYALLSEPSATSVITRAASSGTSLHRNLDMNEEWVLASGGTSQSAIAGTIALGGMTANDEVIAVFLEKYREAVTWMMENPVEAGELGAEVLSEQGFTAEILTGSLENITWRFVPASEGYQDIEAFLLALMSVSVNYTGGRLPDKEFYYEKSPTG